MSAANTLMRKVKQSRNNRGSHIRFLHLPRLKRDEHGTCGIRAGKRHKGERIEKYERIENVRVCDANAPKDQRRKRRTYCLVRIGSLAASNMVEVYHIPCTVPCSWYGRNRASWCRRSVSSSWASAPRTPDRAQVRRRCASCSRRSASSPSPPRRSPSCPCFCPDPDPPDSFSTPENESGESPFNCAVLWRGFNLTQLAAETLNTRARVKLTIKL